jgi:hypothetical protein
MGKFSRNKSLPARRTVSPWMTAFYICGILLLPMLFMGAIPTASAEEDVQEPIKENAVTGPGKYNASLKFDDFVCGYEAPLPEGPGVSGHTGQSISWQVKSANCCDYSNRHRSWNHIFLRWYNAERQSRHHGQ